MVMILPMYEQEQPGVLYNTAAVVDADGKYLGKYRKTHIPQVKGFWEKFYFRPGNLGYPVFDTAVGKVGVYICYDRHFPEGWRALGLGGAQIVFNPSATSRGLSAYLWQLEQPASARWPTSTSSARSTAPASRTSATTTSTAQSYFVDPEGKFVGDVGDDAQPGADRARPRPRACSPRCATGGVLPRPPARRVRETGAAVSMLIKGGTVVGPSGATPADVLVDGEKIVAVFAPGRGPEVEDVIDATGKYVIPGGVDAHTHMELPFGGTFASDTFDTGTRAAAFGGTTTIIDFAVQRTGEVVQDGLAAWHAKADGNCHIDYAFHMILGGVDDDSLKAMDQLVVDEGITSFKLFMAYPGVFYSDDGQILRAMQKARDNGAMIMMHAENGIAIDVLVQQALSSAARPTRSTTASPGREALEAEATSRAIWLASVAADCPLYIVHLSASKALEQVAAARDLGRNVFAETCPQYLYLTLEDQLGAPGFEGAKWVCSTPLRSGKRAAPRRPVAGPAQQRPVRGLHRPLPLLHEGPEGAGHRRLLEDPQRHRRRRAPRRPASTRGSSTGKLSLARWVETIATTPARMFGLYPKKGIIAPGSDADIVLYDPSGAHPHQRRDAPHEHGLLRVGGFRGRRQGRHRHLARHRHRLRRRIPRPSRPWTVRAPGLSDYLLWVDMQDDHALDRRQGRRRAPAVAGCRSGTRRPASSRPKWSPRPPRRPARRWPARSPPSPAGGPRRCPAGPR